MKLRIGMLLVFLLAGVLGLVYGIKESDWNINTRLTHSNPFAARIVWLDEPQTRATLLWNTMTRPASATIHWDTVSHQGNLDEYPLSASVGDSTRLPSQESFRMIDQFEMWSHRFQWTDLKPAQTYYFVIHQNETVSREYHFTTAPFDTREVTILYGADSRSGWEERRVVNQQIASTIDREQTLLAFCHGGDFVGEGIYLDHWYHWLEDYELMIPESGKLLPMIPARGNHDKGKLYNLLFGMDAAHPNYYALQIRPDLNILTLNCNLSYAGQQLDWMTATLASYDQADWVIVQYHLPAFPAVKRSGPAKQYWVSHWEQMGVDVACEADGHCIKRTAPLMQGHPDSQGIVYIGEGGLGVKQRTPKTSGRHWLEGAYVGSGHHFQLLRFSQHEARVETISWDGDVLDTFALKQRASRTAVQIADPKKEAVRRQ